MIWSDCGGHINIWRHVGDCSLTAAAAAAAAAAARGQSDATRRRSYVTATLTSTSARLPHRPCTEQSIDEWIERTVRQSQQLGGRQ